MPTATPHHIAIIGSGMAAIACARTLVQAGHKVQLFEKSSHVGGRMATCETAFGSFDHGAQYFTVRDPRFAQALATTPEVCRAWSANTVQVLDAHGAVTAAALPSREAHWIPKPGMNTLLQRWAEPLLATQSIALQSCITAIETDALNPQKWQLRSLAAGNGVHVVGGFDAVVLAIPSPQALALLSSNARCQMLATDVAKSSVAPCWTLMLAFAQAVRPGLTTLGPQWNAARSTHHRVAWLARESSKPGRNALERWTVQASAAWSQEHLHDEPQRVCAKLTKAFAEITGIRAQATFAQVHRWNYAQTQQALGVSHLWDSKIGVGICGDWCLGHRVENAFVSGLELALAMV